MISVDYRSQVGYLSHSGRPWRMRVYSRVEGAAEERLFRGCGPLHSYLTNFYLRQA